MKDYRQFLIDTQHSEKLAAEIKGELARLEKIYPSKTERELLTVAAKAHGYDFSVLDIMNTRVVLDVKNQNE